MYRKKLMIAAVCLLLSVGLLLTGTLAWLSKSRPAKGTFAVLSDFEVTGELTFGSDPAKHQGNPILVAVSFSPEAPNYIGNMKYTVQYSGASPALIRVRLLEQWTEISTNEILPAGFLAYTVPADGKPALLAPLDEKLPTIPAAGPEQGGLGEKRVLAEEGVWIDRRTIDYCYYYSVPVQPKTLLAGADGAPILETSGSVELTLIEGILPADIASINPATTEMGLVIEVEAVQPNRYREFWGIDALPQPSLSP